jgi:uncharacterized repeat protein (TIGR03803 family)
MRGTEEMTMPCTIAKSLPRTRGNSCRAFFTFGLLLLLLAGVSSAQAVFTQLVAFSGFDGYGPYYVYLAQGTDGQLYGTTLNGFASINKGVGSIFKVTTTGALTDMYTFDLGDGSDGAEPAGGLVLAPNGNFYGTTSVYGLTTEGVCDTGIYGCGTIFEITPAGTLTVLHTFTGPDGFLPYSNLTLGTDGNLYGTTLYGGNQSAPECSGIGCGTVFKITQAGVFTSLYSFCSVANCTDGGNPFGRLFQAANGNFYGTNSGTIFEITPAGKLTTVYTFGANPNLNSPYGGVVQGSDGNFYGTAAEGGANAYGGVYKLVGKNLIPLYSFCSLPNCADGNYPYAGLIQGTDGNFYGTTGSGGPSAGTVFEITPAGNLTTLYTFCSQPQCADGTGPYGGVLQATDGNLYGTTDQGGATNGPYGTVFSISIGLNPFVQSVTTQGKVGASVTILGTNLTGATAVNFGAGAANITTNSGTAITTSVPSGATTGLISVTTPSGTLNSNATFKVIPQIIKFSPISGAVGTAVTIKGVSLTQALKVTFGGVAATSYTINSDTQITATVPTGAKTGKIVITTSGGTATSKASFTVTE